MRDADFARPNGNHQPTRPLARRLAALEFSPGVVIAIAVGGAVFVFVALSIIMVIVLRVRQRHHLAISRTARRRRLSLYAGNVPIVGDNSYTQSPRPRNVLRHNTHAPYMPNNGWRAISSRESLPHKPLLKGLSRALVVDGRQSKQDRPRRSWPLSTRRKAGSVIPLAHLEGSPLSAITERSGNNSAPSPDGGRIAELPAENSPRLTPEKTTEPNAPEIQDCSHSEIWPTTPLRPRPLFHGYDTKRSAERVSQFSAVEKYESIASIVDAVKRGANLERPARPRALSRSVSLCSQQSGLAPDEPMPPLPLRTPVTAMHRHHRRNSEDSPSRYSSGSYETANSSILVDRDSEPFSQTGTDLTSYLASPPLSFRTSRDPRKHEIGFNGWNPAAMTNLELPSHGRHIMRGFDRNQLQAMSTRIRDAQHSVSRDSSSGLSMDIAEQLDDVVPRRTHSNASWLARPGRELPQTCSDSLLRTPTPMGLDSFSRRHSYYGPTPSGRSSYRNSFVDRSEDPRSKRASASILQDVSGNRTSPARGQSQRRPYSLPGSNVCQDARLLIRPSALKGGSGFRPPFHRRQNCVRMSILPPVIIGPTTFPPTEEEPEETPETPTHKPRIPGLTLRNPPPHPLPKPPSSATFDPQIPPSPDYRPTCQALPLPPEGTHYPTHSIPTLYPTSPSPPKRNRNSATSEESIFNPRTDRPPSSSSSQQKHLSTASSSIWSYPGLPTPTIRSFPHPPPLTTHSPTTTTTTAAYPPQHAVKPPHPLF